MDTHKLAELLYPHITATPEQIERRFPKRELPQGAMVTRFAPSPTGFMHIGNLYGALIDELLAHQSGGVFMLRIEDTDQKREIEGGVELIIKSLAHYNVNFDEGAGVDGDTGLYGPYRQSRRAEIYQTYAKKLVLEGKAYPCFCTEDELSEMRSKQETGKHNFGYYGQWARHRDMPLEEIYAALEQNIPFVLRFKSSGNAKNTVNFTDLVKGKMSFPENDQDHVLLKSNGIPTYHFAHAVDDHLMGTTHVVRGEEWLATLPLHLQLFEALGWEPPLYVHTASVQKLDEGGKRKLSKRKDPEAALTYYASEGYPVLSVNEYLMTLLNSNYEEWRLANPALQYTDFPFSAAKMSVSGALFDLTKLRDVSKRTIATYSAHETVELLIEWAKENDREFFELLDRYRPYTESIFAIGRGGEKPRKDLACWNEARAYCSFFFDELFIRDEEMTSEQQAIADGFAEIYDPEDDQTVWFDKLKKVAAGLGYATDTKLYKQNPQDYKGSVSDAGTALRIAVTGRRNSPDLHAVMRILGKERTLERLKGR